MKKAFFFFLFLLSFLSFSQTKEFTLIFKDVKTGNLIENVLVNILRTNENFLSNKEGLVKFKLDKPSRIIVSQTEYKQVTLNSVTFKEPELIIELESISQDIEDVVITNRQSFSILKTLINKSMKQLTAPINLKIYSREFFKYNNEYTSYSDGLVNFCLKEKPDKFAADILVEQNRTYNLINNEKIEKKTLSYNMYDIIQNYYDFKYINNLAESKAKKKFEFEIKTVRGKANFYQMVITPKPEIEEFLPTVTIVYDFKKNIILELEYFVEPNRFEFSDVSNLKVVKGKVFNSTFKALYLVDGDDYFLASTKEEIGIMVKDKKDVENKVEVINYLMTTQHSRKFVPYQKDDVFKEKSLINKKNSIITEYWETNSGLLLTKEEKKIVDNLQLNAN
ncbi:hypothetical protein [Flavobacterium difficile]|uniref:Carboxypeptidase-like regulatory domain-containing protein n=1 Tax=Flavobacterium difficile TaxID=2709659 RepID=A0ABX0I2J5_9FLAO|nr:hypothetical protein [Flavobacterium difficile]NHM01401.1 hypothetical protein [Flavobacterium difficile]